MLSQRGASLPLALLLVLVCAMAASVVLAAGTAAAGRVSDLAENDQAYYSTTSAINLFRNQLVGADGKGYPVTFAVKRDASAGSASYQVLARTDGATEDGAYTLLERAAAYMLFGDSTVRNNSGAQSAVDLYFTAHSWDSWPNQSQFSSGEFGSFDITHETDAATTLDAAQIGELELQVDAKIDANDRSSLILSFQKKGAGSSGDKAAFTMKCEANIETGVTAAGANSEIKFVTVTWTPSAIEKGSAGS